MTYGVAINEQSKTRIYSQKVIMKNIKNGLKKPIGELSGPKDITEIFLLKECSAKCKDAYKKCLEKSLKNPALICVECVEICNLTIKFLTCNSEFSSPIIKLCKMICERCEEECLKIDEEECRLCAAECRRCVDYFSTSKTKRKNLKIVLEQV